MIWFLALAQVILGAGAILLGLGIDGSPVWEKPLALMSAAILCQGALLLKLFSEKRALSEKLNRRLEGYAALSEKFGRCAKHQILLGTLKKVEQKAASLAAIVVFLAIAVVTVGASDMKSPETAQWFYALLLPLLPVFTALILAFKQVDGFHLDDEAGSDADTLHNRLKDDLLDKEIAFRFAWVATQGYSAFVGAGLFVWVVFLS